MFCLKCGAQNDDTSKFCMKCGAELFHAQAPQPEPIVQDFQPELQQQPEPQQFQSQPEPQQYQQPEPQQFQFQPEPQQYQQPEPQQYQQPYQEYGPAPAQPMPKKGAPKGLWILLVEIAVVAAAAVLLVLVAMKAYSPQTVAEKFFVAGANNDGEGMMAVTRMPENTTLTAADLTGLMDIGGVVQEYELRTETSEDGNRAVCEVAFVTEGKTSPDIIAIPLEKTGAKNLLFFDDWKVVLDTEICDDFKILAPGGLTLTINGKPMTEEPGRINEDGLSTYDAPEMFAGEYDVNVSGNLVEPCTKTVYVSRGGQEVINDIVYSESAIIQLQDTASENLKEIYSAAVAGEDFPAIKDLFVSDGGQLPSIRQDYEYLVRSFAEVGAVGMSVNNVRMTSSTDRPVVNVSFDYMLAINGYDYFTGQISSNYYNDSAGGTFTFAYENGRWVQTSIGVPILY